MVPRTGGGFMKGIRVVLVVVLAASAVVLQNPASARCTITPLDELVKDSEAVWWVTVNEAFASTDRSRGVWQLTVRVDDVLKGPGPEGGTATVYTSDCGPFIGPEEAAEVGLRFVGQQRLLTGSIGEDGALDAFGQVVSPQGLTAKQRHARALAILGLPPPLVTAPQPAVPGASGPGWPVALALGVVALLVGASAVAARRKKREGSEARRTRSG
jgi:hypothetical protein